MLRYAKGAYFWVMSVAITAFFCSWCALMHAAVVLLGEPRDGRRVHPIAARWGRTVFKLTPGWELRLEGTEHLPSVDEPVVVVANHQSLIDILVMYSLPLQFRWLSKEEIFKIPLLGPVMRWAAYVPIRRGHRESHAEAAREAEERVKMGLSMFYFPEGTRSEDGGLKDFKLGAFKLARDMQVRVLPVALNGARNLMPKGGKIPQSATVRMRVLPLMAPPPLDGETLESYAGRVRETIAGALAEIRHVSSPPPATSRSS